MTRKYIYIYINKEVDYCYVFPLLFCFLITSFYTPRLCQFFSISIYVRVVFGFGIGLGLGLLIIVRVHIITTTTTPRSKR